MEKNKSYCFCHILTPLKKKQNKNFFTNPWDYMLNMEQENDMKTLRFVLVLENRDSYSMFFQNTVRLKSGFMLAYRVLNPLEGFLSLCFFQFNWAETDLSFGTRHATFTK